MKNYFNFFKKGMNRFSVTLFLVLFAVLITFNSYSFTSDPIFSSNLVHESKIQLVHELSDYRIDSLNHGDIVFGEPVSWELILLNYLNGSKSKVVYETLPIYRDVAFFERNNGNWIKYITLYSGANVTYSFEYSEEVPPSDNLLLNPPLEYDLINNSLLVVQVEFNKSLTYTISGKSIYDYSNLSEHFKTNCSSDNCDYYNSILDDYALSDKDDETYVSNNSLDDSGVELAQDNGPVNYSYLTDLFMEIFDENTSINNTQKLEDGIVSLNSTINVSLNSTDLVLNMDAFNLSSNLTANLTTNLTNLSDSILFSLPVKNKTFLHELGSFKMAISDGNLNNLIIDDELNLEFLIDNLSLGEEVEVNLTLPFILPDNVEFYLWKNISGKTVNVPFNVSESRDLITLYLQDGVIDDDGMTNGVIFDPLQLFIPKTDVSVEGLDSKQKLSESYQKNVLAILKKNNVTKNVKLSSSKGNINSLKFVDPKNTVDSPINSDDFEFDLMKFTIKNVTDSEDIYFSYDSLPNNFKVLKFNPNTVNWYYFPYERINSTTFKLTIVDGGFGDDDGLVNGIIVDDLGIVSDWWNDSWSYRQEINITNTDTNSNISGYQIELSFTESSVGDNFNWSDNSSLRFTQYNSLSSTESELDYYIVDWDSSAKTATVLVETNFIPAANYDDGLGDGVALILMYYDNPSASSISSKSDTFTFYDDFSSDTTSNYKEVDADTQPGTNFSITSGFYNLTGSGADTWTGYDQYSAAALSVSGDFEASLKILSQTYSNSWAKAGFMLKNNASNPGSSTGYVFVAITPGHGFTWQRDSDNNGYLNDHTEASSGSFPNYVKLIKSGTSLSSYYSSDGDSWSLISTITMSSVNYTQDLSMAVVSHDNSALCEVHFDDFAIKKYTSATITTSLGEEYYHGSVVVDIDEPSNGLNLTRNSLFEMNGTVNCSVGDCGTVKTTYQYLATTTPLLHKTYDSTLDFLNFKSSENISIGNDHLKLDLSNSDDFWWDKDWKYRQFFNISSSLDIYNYTLELNLSTSNVGSNFDFSDNSSLRFVIANSDVDVGKISYFISDWNSVTKTGKVYVKIPYLNSSSDNLIWMYYGNSEATSESNYYSSFLVSDDFSNSTINDFWSTVDLDSTSGTGFGIKNGNLEINASGADTWTSIDEYASVYSRVSGNFSAIAKITSQENTNSWAKAGIMVKNDMSLSGTSTGYVFMVITPGHSYSYQRDSDNNGYLNTNNQGGSTAYPAYVKLVRSGTTLDGYYSVDGINWSLVNSEVISSVGDSLDVGLSVTSHTASTESTVDFDNVLVKRFVSSVPTYLNGSEEDISFKSSGEYISSSFDTGSNDVRFENISWESSTNENVSLNVYTRTSGGAEGAWWDKDWSHRVIAEIDVSDDLSDFPVQIIINTSKMYSDGYLDSDCSDLRFVIFDSDHLSYSEQNYFIESCEIGGKNSTIWVNVSDLSSSNTNELHIYYDNSAVESKSNYKGVFEFYDDFDGSSLNSTLWTATSPSDVVVSGGNLLVKAGSIYSNSVVGRSDNLIVESKVHWTESTGDSFSGLMTVDVQNMQGSNSGSDANVLYMTSSGGSSTVTSYAGDGTTSNYNLANNQAVFTRVNNQDYVIGTAFNGTNTILYEDYSEKVSFGTFNESIYAYLGYFTGSNAGSTDIQDLNVSWIRTRKISSSTVQVSINSEEEYSSVVLDEDNYVWSSWFLETNNVSIQSPAARYIQFKYLFTTSNLTQSPLLDSTTFSYRVSAKDWTDITSDGTIFSGSSPVNNGALNMANQLSYPTLNILPKCAGEFSLRLKSSSSVSKIEDDISDYHNVTVWIQPAFNSFKKSSSIGALNNSVELSVTLEDDATVAMENYNVSFYDNTANGSTLLIGSVLTDSSGLAKITYLIPDDSLLGNHNLNISYSGDVSQYIKPVSLSETLFISSNPEIINVKKTPFETGFGLSINISANITDSVGIDSVFINISDSNSNSNLYAMNEDSDIYYYIFNDTWVLDDYTFEIIANNTDGVETRTSADSFSINSYGYFNFTTDKLNYKNNELVDLKISLSDSVYSTWNYVRGITFNSSFEDTEYPVRIDLNNMNFDFSLVELDGSDIRFTYINSTSEEEVVPFWIEKLDVANEEGIIWVRCPFISSSSENKLNLYYGNDNASIASDGSSTFNFFDDFDGSSLNSTLWTATSSSDVVVSGGSLLVKAGSVYSNSVVGRSDNLIIESKVHWTENTGDSYSGLITVDVQDMHGSNSDADANILYMTSSGGSSIVRYWAGDGSATGYNLGNADVFTRVSDQDYVLGTAFNGTNTILYKDYLAQTSFGTFNESVYAYLGSFYGSGSGTTDIQDINASWIRARKFHPETINAVVGSHKFNKIGLLNTGSTDFKGYLGLNVQRWTGSIWQNIIPPVIDHEEVRINASKSLDLSTLWSDSGSWNTSTRTPGKYRVRAILTNPSRQVLTTSDSNLLDYTYEFNIIKPILIMNNLTYENSYEYSLKEYEVGDTIDWINVTVSPINNTAYSSNVSLSILDNNFDYLGWGPQNESKLCGDLLENELCENRWDNSSNGYTIPYSASSGDYTFYWNILMKSETGDDTLNNSLNFKIHNIPSTIDTSLSSSRIYKPGSSIYNFTFTNLWLENLSDVNVTINCPSITGFVCNVVNEGVITKNVGVLGNETTITISYNISINESVLSDNYLINATLSYVNPSNESHTWAEVGVQTIEARLKGILTITDYLHPLSVTRLSEYDFSSYVNNSAEDQANSSWLNYTLPTNWLVTSGSSDLSLGDISANELAWNNISIKPELTSSLGAQTIRLDSGADDGRNDFKIYYVDVFADTNIEFIVENSLVNRGENVTLFAKLSYDNGTIVSDANLTFYDNTESLDLGSALTNSSGWATFEYYLNSTTNLGQHTLNVSYLGDNSLYLRNSTNSTLINVHEVPKIENIRINPSTIGFGETVLISADITDSDDIDKVLINITNPDGVVTQAEMSLTTPPKEFTYTYENTWIRGVYNITIIANDTTGAEKIISNESFLLNTSLTLSIQTKNNSYGQNQKVNLSTPKSFWWDGNWAYRKKFNITNIGSNLNNYQQKIILDTGSLYSDGKIKSDCGDIRFVYFNESNHKYSELDYYLENDVCNISSSQTSIYWVRIPEIKSSGYVIEAYYGNDEVSTTKVSGNVMFPFFDDFDGSSLDSTLWTATSPSDAIVSDGKLLVKAGSVYSNSVVGRSDNLIVESKLRWLSGTGSVYSGLITVDVQDMQGSNSGADANVLYMTNSGGSATVGYWAGDGTTTGYNLGDGNVFTRVSDQDYVLGTAFNGTNTTLYKDYSEQLSFGTFNESVYAYLGYFIGSGSGSSDIQDINVSWIRTRKFMYPEPTVTSLSEEMVGAQIINGGSTNSSGYLFMSVQYNDSGVWTNVSTVIDDISTNTLRNISESYLDLSSIWNPISWDTSTHDYGTYRVYGKLVDKSGTMLTSYGGINIENNWEFEIEKPSILLNISNISIYDVTNTGQANWHIFTNELVDSGLNKSFTLNKDHIYRFEVEISNVGTSNWDINETSLKYGEYNNSWGVDESSDIWYSTQTLLSNRRSDTSKEGGLFNGVISWNETDHDGSVSSLSKATFFFVMNITSAQDLGIILNLSHTTFEKLDYSQLHIIELDTTPPKLVSGTNNYNISNNSIIRGNSTNIFAFWDETIARSNVTYTTSSDVVYVTSTNNSPQNSQNLTNFTIQSSSAWNLGLHYAKILVTDESGNVNDSLVKLNFTVNGLAQLTSMTLNSSTLKSGDSLKINCKVTDYSNSNDDVENYVVTFKNSTNVLGTNLTNSTGWATFVYTDTSLGNENISCIISENSSTHYFIDNNNKKSLVLRTIELEPPEYVTVSYPLVAHRGESVALKVNWSDNYNLSNATLEINASGTFVNDSSLSITGVGAWANFTFSIPISTSLGNISWRQYADDYFANTNKTKLYNITIWGYSKLSSSSLSPSSIQETNYSMMSCVVIDANSSTKVSGYNVSFYYKNSTDSSYTFLGTNISDSLGIANYTFSVSTAGTYDVMCNISDSNLLLYNASEDNEEVKELNVVSGADVLPPKILNGNYDLNDTEIYRGECIKISGQWDESLNISYVEYNLTSSNITRVNISMPYSSNWTNLSICTDNSWIPGNYSIKLYGKDLAGNVNYTLPYFNFVMTAKSEVNYDSPLSNVDRGVITLVCNVSDVDLGTGIENYQVTFFDQDLGFSIGTNLTNSSGQAELTYDFSSHDVGPDEITCSISDDDDKFYLAETTSDAETLNLYGYLYVNITDPENNSVINQGTTIDLISGIVDENGNIPLNYLGATASLNALWFDETSQIASGNETTWDIPVSYPGGEQNITFNVTENYYYMGEQVVVVKTYGVSNVEINNPLSDTFYSSNKIIDLICNVSDNADNSGIDNYPVEFYDGSTLLGKNKSNSLGISNYYINSNSLSDIQHTLKCVIYDNDTLLYTSGVNVSSVNITVDKINPLVNYTSSSDTNGTYNRNWTLVEVEITETNVESVLLNWSGNLETMTTLGSGIFSLNKTNLSDGNYLFNVFVNDSAGNSNSTVYRNITIDTIAPTITIISPTSSNYSNSLLELNISLNEDGLTCQYSIDSGLNNSMDQVNSTYFNSTHIFTEGNHLIKFYCNDTINNTGMSSINIDVDLTNPNVSIVYPVDTTEYTTSNDIDLNFTASDNYELSNCKYSLDGTSNVTLSDCLNTTLLGLSNSNHSLDLYVIDSSGRINSSSIWFVINVSALTTSITYPLDGETYSQSDLEISANVNKAALSCNYSVDSGSYLTMTNYSELSWNETMSSLSDGLHNVSVRCSDGNEVVNSSVIYFTIDTIGPTIDFVSPTPSNNSNVEVPYVFVNVSLDGSADVVLLELTNSTGSYNLSMISFNATSYYYNLSGLVSGNIEFKVFANDSFGNMNTSELRELTISLEAPIITIESPLNNTLYGYNLLDLNVSASKTINKWWFELNGESFDFIPNLKFAAAQGMNNLTVFANDTIGLVGNSSITFNFSGETWEDSFKSYTGLLNSTGISADPLNLSSCWLVQETGVNPQDKLCFPYRKELDVTAGSSLSNYQVMLKLNLSTELSSGKVKSDCSDLRFSYYNQTSNSDEKISYFVESCNDLNEAIIWLKIPVIDSNSKIHVYYGEDDAESESDGTAVFEFFDDFNSMSSSWGSNYNNWYATESIAYANNSLSDSKLENTYNFGSSFATELKLKGNSSSGVSGYYKLGNSAGSKYLTLYLDPANNRVDLYNGANNYHSINISEMTKLSIVSDFLNNNYKLFVNNSDTSSLSLTSTSSGSNQNPVFYTYNVNGVVIDFIGVRKYSSSAINIGSLGSEETTLENGSITSIAINKNSTEVWTYFNSSFTLPAGTDLSFEVLNSSLDSVCGEISRVEVGAGYSVCDSANLYDTIYLRANLETVGSNTPIINNWNISFTTDLDSPIVNLTSPIDNYFNDTDEYVNLTFKANVSENNYLVNCSLWTDYEGSWKLNDTISYVNKTQFEVPEFTLINLNGSHTFDWNVYCYDLFGNLGYAGDNWTIKLNYSGSDLDSPIISGVSPNGTKYSKDSSIDIRVNVTDASAFDVMYVDISRPELNITERYSLILISGDTYGVTFSNTSTIGPYNYSIFINDSYGNNVTTTASFDVTSFETIDLISSAGINISNIQSINSQNGLLDVEINVTDSDQVISKIEIFGFNSSASSVNELLIENQTNDYVGRVETSFSVNPERINFTSINITFLATGKHLYKCVNFSFDSQTCTDEDDYDQVKTDLIPGQNYTITLTPQDPSYYITIEGASNISDSYLRNGGKSDSNYGGNVNIRVGRGKNSNRISRGIIWFNLSYIPSDAIINSANLSLYFENVVSTDNTGNRTHEVHRVLQSPNRDWTELGVTWNDYKSSTSWSTAGGDFNATPTDTQNFNGSAEDTRIRYDVTSDVQSFVRDGDNFGWIIKDQDETQDYWRINYASSEDAKSRKHPILEINYTILRPDLKVSNITFSPDDIIEGNNLTIDLNISNVGDGNASNTSVQLNISIWNGSDWELDTVLNSTNFSIYAGNNTTLSFNWTARPGPWKFESFVDYKFNITELNETNNYLSKQLDISSWYTQYGIFNLSKVLADDNGVDAYSWNVSDSEGNVYLSDIDSNYLPFNLEPLNGTNDLTELDAALGTTYFNDSISNLFDQSRTTSFNIGGTIISDVPFINSTNSSNFITGIFFDSNDNSEYTGVEDVVFITKINRNKNGKYGVYDYEIAVPVFLRELKGTDNRLKRVDEII